MTKKPKKVKAGYLFQRKDDLYYKKYAKVPFSGVSEEFWENSQLKSRDHYKEGYKHGSYQWFYENGQLSSQGVYHWGKPVSFLTNYFDKKN